MRLAAVEKMGFYPTGDSTVDRIKRLLLFPTTSFTAMDPCAGKGEAIARLLHGSSGKGFAVELDKERAQACAEKDISTEWGDAESLVTPEGSFSLLWLNPPYDRYGGERGEVGWLQKCLPFLKRSGVLVFIIPQHVLEPTAYYLARNLDEVTVFRYPDRPSGADRRSAEYFDIYKQVVVFGYRESRSHLQAEPVSAALKKWGAEGRSFRWTHDHNSSIPVLPNLEAVIEETFEVPRAQPPPYFRLGMPTVEEIASLAEHSILSGWSDRFSLPPDASAHGRPPAPLKLGHVGLLVASGQVRGFLGEGANRHFVMGFQRKVQDETDEGVIDRWEVAVKILTPDGAIQVLRR